MKDQVNLYKYEEQLYDQGYELICGVDEVGRGPLAGPVVVCACILPQFKRIEGLNDSKQLSDKKRRELYKKIIKEAEEVFPAQKYFSYYSLFDVDKDGVPELFLKTGTCEADYQFEIYSFYEKEQLVYIDSDERLFEITSGKNKKFLDDEVKGFVRNEASDKLFYQKDDGCYYIVEEMPQMVCKTSKSGYTLIWDGSSDKIWYYDQSNFYEVYKQTETGYELMAEVSVVYFAEENCVYFLEKSGELRCAADKVTTVSDKVSDMVMVEGATEIAFLKENTVYINKYKSRKSINIFNTTELNLVIYSQKKYYLTDLSSILWAISENGKDKSSLGNVENYILMD